MASKKMKALRRWALIYDDGTVRGMLQPDTYCTRRDAREKNRQISETYGRICRIARVEIREIP